MATLPTRKLRPRDRLELCLGTEYAFGCASFLLPSSNPPFDTEAVERFLVALENVAPKDREPIFELMVEKDPNLRLVRDNAAQLQNILDTTPELTDVAAKLPSNTSAFNSLKTWIAARRRTDDEAKGAALAVAERAKKMKADAAIFVTGLPKRGLQIDIVGGKVRVFPRSLMTDAERSFLAIGAADLIAAIEAETMFSP